MKLKNLDIFKLSKLIMSSIGFPKNFDKNVSNVIATFLTPIPHKFLTWIPIDKLDWHYLSSTLSVQMCAKYSDKIKIESLVHNENAIEYIQHLIKKGQFIAFKELCENKNAIPILKQNKQNIHWDYICSNENAIDLIREYTSNMTENLEDIDLEILCGNKNAIPLLEEFIDLCFVNKNKLNWSEISKNENAFSILKKNLDRVDWLAACNNKILILLLQELKPKDLEYVLSNELNWKYVSSNKQIIPFFEHILDTNPKLSSIICNNLIWNNLCSNRNSISFLSKLTNNFTTNLQYICWIGLSFNENAFDLLEEFTKNFTENLDKICWVRLCSHYNAKAIEIIEQNMDKLVQNECWMNLAQNTNAIHFIQKNLDKIPMTYLSRNRNIFEINTKLYKKQILQVSNLVYTV